ncbi:ASCH domain-containing protein [Bacillus paranthracis]
MRYEMGLYNKPFQSIQSGKKVYEVRLYDKKASTHKTRRSYCIYEPYDSKATMAVKVTEIKRYKNFQAMYEQIDKKLLDCGNDSLEGNVRKYIQNIYERTRTKVGNSCDRY